MSISLDTSSAQVHLPVSNELNMVDPTQRLPSNNISNPASTLASCNGSEESDGFCVWLGKIVGEIWRSIKACFGFASEAPVSAVPITSETPVTEASISVVSTVSTSETPVSEVPLSVASTPIVSTSVVPEIGNAETRLNSRIEKGKEIIEAHLGSDLFNNDANRIGVLFLIKYNRQILVPFRKLSEGKEHLKENAITQLTELLGSHSNRQCDSTLEIATMIVQKNDEDNFIVNSTSSSIQFPNVDRSDRLDPELVINRQMVRQLLDRAMEAGTELSLDRTDMQLQVVSFVCIDL